MFEYRHRLLREIIEALFKYEKIKRVDFYMDNEDDTVIDSLIEEMIRCEYLISDFDELGDVILKRKIRDTQSDIIDEKSNAILIKSTNKWIINNYIFYDGEIKFRDNNLLMLR